MILQTLREFAGRSNKDMPGHTVPSSDQGIASKSSPCPESLGQGISKMANLAVNRKEGTRTGTWLHCSRFKPQGAECFTEGRNHINRPTDEIER